ncbi:MAG: hypothetical protein ACW986_11440 [Promethearchaeota archaeon]|jgi:hypothetical protein
MSVGKRLSVVAGIITLLATFLFSWYAIDVGGGDIYYASGLGIIKNIPAMFTNSDALGTTLGIPGFSVYIVAVSFILFLAAGIFQILGIKSRALVLLGTIFVLGIALLMFLGSANVIEAEAWIVNMIGTNVPLVDGIIPLKILGLGTFDIGMYLLYASGIIGIIATIYGPSGM